VPSLAVTEQWSEAHLRLAVKAACVALWSWNVDDDAFHMDERGYELWDVPYAQSVRFEDLSANIHPADRNRVRAAFQATRSAEGSYEIDFRIIVQDEIRWVSARGQGADAGIIDRTMFGVFLDVTGRKQAEEGSELLAGEMSHRVKNLLTIAASLTAFTSRSAQSVEDMAHELINRLSALGRAHDLVRPLPGSQGTTALLGDLLSVLVSPYDAQGAFSGRIRVAVPRMGVGEKSATALAMIFHELATNSAKHGALSSVAGALDISGVSDDDTLTIVWAETGGPEVPAEPQLSGFGSRMVQKNLARPLGGAISYEWQPTGLVATLTMQVSAMAR